MKTRVTVPVVVILVGLIGFPAPGVAQPPPPIHDFTDVEVTKEKLIEVLKPRGPALHTRGIGPVGGKPNCKHYRDQRTRGIGPVAGGAPASDAAAIRVHFAFNSAHLSPEATRTLDELGSALTSHELESCCFQIEGHTDGIGSAGYNLRLSERRAQSVVRYLRKQFGIDIDRLLAVGHGKKQPIADNSTETGRQKNRRVQIVNLGFGTAAGQ